MADWTQADPGEGSTAGLTSSMSTLTTFASRATTVSDAATRASAAVGPTTWSGTGVAEWQRETGALLATLPDIHSAFTAAHRALSDYTSALESIKTRQQVYVSEIRDAQRLVQDIPLIRAPWDVEGIADDTTRKVRAASKEFDAIQGLLHLAGERSAADDALVSALSKAVPPTWNEQHKALVAAGITNAKSVDAASIAAALVKLTRKDLDGTDPDALTELSALLDLYGDDQQTMSTYFQKLGGADTASIIDQLGDEYSINQYDQYLALAQKLRAGLSVGSANWTDAEAKTFSDGLFTGTPSATHDQNFEGTKRDAAIAYLFSNVADAPMGKGLTVAAADAIDKIERANKSALTCPPWPNNQGADSLYAGEHHDRASHEMTPGGQYYYSLGQDLSGRVLETLGHYPDAALDFVNTPDAKLNDARIDYWFGTRDWSQEDKFEGPASLWLGIEQATGGPFSDSYDPSSALITSKILWSLYDNTSFHSSNVSEDASGELATALAPNLDALAEYMLHRGSDATGADETTVTAFGSDTTREVPVISDKVMAEILGAIGSHKEGATILQNAIDAYQKYYAAGGAVDRQTLADSLNRSNWLQGALDGSGAEATLNAARQYDAQVDKSIDTLMTIVGLIPIPGVGELIPGGSKLLDAVGGLAQGQVQDLGVQAWKDNLHTAQATAATIADRADRLQAQALLKFVDQLRAAVGPSVIGPVPTEKSGETAAHYGERLNSWWQAKAKELDDGDVVPKMTLQNIVGEYDDIRDANGFRVTK